MAPSQERPSAAGRQEDVHAVGVFRPTTDDDGRPSPAPDRQPGLEHLGRDAARRAIILGLVVGAIGAIVLALVVAGLTDVRGPALVATVIGGGVLLGAIGALWGAFSRLGKGDDWREAVTAERRPAQVVHDEAHRTAAADSEVDELESKGATEVHVTDDDPSRRPENRLDQ
jgi:hypothetical protein